MRNPKVGSARRSTIPTNPWLSVAVLLVVAFIRPVASGAAPSRPAIPANFHAQSLSFVSPRRGWMLGAMPCDASICTSVVRTSDGGGSWTTVGTLSAPLSFEEESGVTQVRFADDRNGWAFEPGLYATTDGGATWQPQPPPGGGHLVLALAADPQVAYAVVSPCKLNRLCNHPSTLWRTTPGAGSWTQVSLTLPAITAFDSVVLAVRGEVAYLAIPSALLDGLPADMLDVTVDGEQWSARPDPCVPSHDEALADVAPISDTSVAFLCVGDPGFSEATKRVRRSDDYGQTTRPAGQTDRLGIVSRLAAAPDGTLVVSSYSDGSWIYRNARGRTWTTPVSLADLGEGWNDLVFTTNRLGFVIHGPWVFCCGGGPGELWETHDGGVTWSPENGG